MFADCCMTKIKCYIIGQNTFWMLIDFKKRLKEIDAFY